MFFKPKPTEAEPAEAIEPVEPAEIASPIEPANPVAETNATDLEPISDEPISTDDAVSILVDEVIALKAAVAKLIGPNVQWVSQPDGNSVLKFMTAPVGPTHAEIQAEKEKQAEIVRQVRECHALNLRNRIEAEKELEREQQKDPWGRLTSPRYKADQARVDAVIVQQGEEQITWMRSQDLPVRHGADDNRDDEGE